ncbi:MAG: VOC family protein [candidate division Zixibacteria bacterium]|nr:VOC family protein [candidate division Zixibacteria bacterium]
MNGVCHFEIPSRDFGKAKKFYGELFNWQFNEMGDEYLLFNPPDGVGGGFSKGTEFTEKPGIIVYIEVEDIPAIIEKAKGMGGECLHEKTQISPEHGFFAILKDLEGNQLGIWAKS